MPRVFTRQVLMLAVIGAIVAPAMAAEPVSPQQRKEMVELAKRALGPDADVSTRVVAGDTPSSLVLVGAGDASLVSAPPRPGEFPAASLSTLARRTATALRGSGVTSVRLGYDATLFTGPAVAPSWEPTYVSSGVIAPVTALMVDQGLVDPDSGSLARAADPAAAAAATFAELLAGRGVSVRGGVRPVEAPEAADTVAEVSSPPVAQLVEHMLTDSDNQLAEALGRLAAVAQGAPASFDGAAATLVAVAEDHGADLAGATVLDASGLSRDDRVSADALATTLSVAVVDPVYRPLTTGLPIAALTGTLVDRFLDPPATVGAGVVRAKTGTLTGVSSEAGLVVTCEGELLAFAFLADRVPYDTEAARAALDQAASALASCAPE